MNQFLRLSRKVLSSVLFLEFSSEDDFENFDRDKVIIVYNYTSYAIHSRVR